MVAEDRLAHAIEEHEREEEFRIKTGGWVRQPVLSKAPPVTLNDPVRAHPLCLRVRNHRSLLWRCTYPCRGVVVQIITGVLQSWTTDQRKIAYVQKWMNDIVKGKKLDNKKVHRGLELCKLTKEVRDGFLMLILPLLKQRPDIDVKVVTREHVVRCCVWWLAEQMREGRGLTNNDAPQEVRTDMRVKVVNARLESPRRDHGDASSVRSDGSADTNATFRACRGVSCHVCSSVERRPHLCCL